MLTPPQIKKPQTNLFKNNLQEALTQRKASETQPPDARILGEVPPPTFCKIENSSGDVVKKTGELIDLLDNYARDIHNPDKALKEIEPLIVEIRDRATQLLQESEKTLGKDSGLKEIAARCALTANVEYIKFRRGDYV
jgi:hypothetical protein